MVTTEVESRSWQHNCLLSSRKIWKDMLCILRVKTITSKVKSNQRNQENMAGSIRIFQCQGCVNTCILSNSAILGEDREKEKTCWNGRATTTRTRTKKIIQVSRDHQPERELESREARRTEGTGRARTHRGLGVGKNTSILFDPMLEKSLLMFMPPRKKHTNWCTRCILQSLRFLYWCTLLCLSAPKCNNFQVTGVMFCACSFGSCCFFLVSWSSELTPIH